jgi:cytidylate kinase
LPEVNNTVSQISKIPEVRTALILIQQRLWSQWRLVADGRDMGSIVFPFADYKFLLTCDLSIRAQRRQKQLGE